MFTALFVTVFVYVSASAQYNFCITPDQYEGRCVPVYSCKPMINAFRQLPQPVPTEIQEYLKEFQCGFNDNTPKVCCPATPITFNKVLDQNNFPDVSRHRKLKLLPRECGVFDDENRIVNGNATQLFEYPWMALLSYESRFGPQFKCAGTIINRNYILTAAHCLANLRQPLLGVRIGEYDIKTTTDCETDTWNGETCSPPHQDLKIQRIIIHPLYNSATFSNDIGLIKTAPMDLSMANAKPICLPLGENRNYNFTNRNIIVTGWGVTETGKSSNTLLQVSLPFVPLDECKKQYFKIAKLSETQLCAGGKTNSDSCAGDSGGPLHAIGNMYSEVRLVQQGIVSFGPRRCGMQKIPGVYTRVAAYMDWILNNIDA